MKGIVAVLVTGALLSAGCASEDCPDSGLQLVASCASGVEYDETFYVQWSDRLPIDRGELLGAAEYPFCMDTLDCTADRAGTPTEVWTLRGADPDDVLVGREQGTGKLVVFGRMRVDPETYFRHTPDGWERRKVSRPS